jgi:hypothetical protein
MTRDNYFEKQKVLPKEKKSDSGFVFVDSFNIYFQTSPLRFRN